MVRTDGHQLRAIAGDSPLAAGVKLLARAHQTLIWERTRHTLRLRAGLREYFPAALAAFQRPRRPRGVGTVGQGPGADGGRPVDPRPDRCGVASGATPQHRHQDC
ncbi:IS110 family transposase [Pseudonocardia sichuanensis]